MNILVIDDEPSYRMLLEDHLRMSGWTVYTASNGEEALKVLGEATINFIISDVYMPIMDGIRFQKAVRELKEYEEVPLLFVSGYDDDHTLQAVRSSKNCGFMKKTRPLHELKAWIDYLMTPLDKRPSMHPGSEQKFGSNIRIRGRHDDTKRK